MAFKGQATSENTGFKMFNGVGSFYVRGVNFNKQEMTEFFGREITTEPTFVDEVEINGRMVKRVNIAIYLELVPNEYKDADGNFINFKTVLYISLVNTPVVGSASGKIQVIDNYGRTAWGTPSEVEAGSKIMYANGPAKIALPYKKVRRGEETLIQFLIAYLNVPSTVKRINGIIVDKTGEELEKCEASIPYIENLFKGDFSDLKSDFSILKDNKVKLLVGIKTTEEGKQRHTIFDRVFMKNGYGIKNGVEDYSYIQTKVDDFLAHTTQNITFEVSRLHEYVVNATDFSNNAPIEENVNDPFGQANDDNLPFDF